MNRFFTPHRILECLAFLILAVAFTLSLILPPDSLTWIPAPQITVPVVNGLCALFCIMLIIRPGIKALEIGILLTQSFFTTWTGYETLGMFLFSALVILLFCYGFFRTHIRQRTIILIAISFICLFGVIPYGIARCVLVYSTLLFMTAFYYAVYTQIKDILSPLLPAQSDKAKVVLPPQGSAINLKECGLSQRQTQILTEYLLTNASYSELADKFIVSISTVKKDMAQALHIFGVKNNEELRFLLSHYRIIQEENPAAPRNIPR